MKEKYIPNICLVPRGFSFFKKRQWDESMGTQVILGVNQETGDAVHVGTTWAYDVPMKLRHSSQKKPPRGWHVGPWECTCLACVKLCQQVRSQQTKALPCKPDHVDLTLGPHCGENRHLRALLYLQNYTVGRQNTPMPTPTD